jgi:hypothetical protein
MLLRRRFTLILISILTTAFAATGLARQGDAPTLTGTWTGTFIPTVGGQQGPVDSAHMVLKQTGVDVTGTAGPNADTQFEIQKGKVATTREGTTFTFDLSTGGPLIKFDLKLVAGRLKGGAKAEADGQTMTAVIDVGRAKQAVGAAGPGPAFGIAEPGVVNPRK